MNICLGSDEVCFDETLRVLPSNGSAVHEKSAGGVFRRG